jgi:predicted acetyltransferase
VDYRIRSARRADLPAVYELVDACFPFAQPELFVRQTESDSSYRFWQTRLIEVDGRIVSHVRIFDRTMWVRGVRMRAGGIGSVATHADYRKHGLASVLLKDAIAQMERRGYHLSFLFTGIPHFYARLGWRVVRMPYYATSAREVAALSGGRGVRVRPFTPADIPTLARIYDRTSGGHTGAIARSKRYWRDHLTWADDDPDGFLVAEAKGGPVAYVRSRIEIDKHLNLLEGIALPGEEGALTSLLASLARYAESEGAAEIRGLVPADSALAGVLRALPSSRVTIDVPLPDMMRVVDLEGMLSRLLPERRQRTQLKVAPEDWIIAVMGQMPVEALAGESATTPSARRAADALERALPPQPLHFWNSDRI